MKVKQAIVKMLVSVTGCIFLAGMAYCVYAFSRGEKHGYYTAKDTLDSYNRGYNDGRENFRRVVIELNRDQNNTYKINLPR